MAKRSNSTTPAAKAAAKPAAAAIAAAGAPTAPAADGEDVAQAGTAASQEAAGAIQPAGDPVPPPVAGASVEAGELETGAAAAAPAPAGGDALTAGQASVSGGVAPDTLVETPPLRVGVDFLIDNFDRSQRAVIEISGPKAGRRRAGHAFGAEPVRLTLAELGEDGLRAIDADPALSWAVVGEMEGGDA